MKLFRRTIATLLMVLFALFAVFAWVPMFTIEPFVQGTGPPMIAAWLQMQSQSVGTNTLMTLMRNEIRGSPVYANAKWRASPQMSLPMNC